MERPIDVSVIVPIFNGADLVEPLLKRLLPVLSVYASCEILLVDDGSEDDTREQLRRAAAREEDVRALYLSRNRGQQRASLCGLCRARGRYLVTIDDDLQHAPEDIPLLLDRLKGDVELVFGVPSPATVRSVHRDIGSRLRDFLFRRISQSAANLRPSSFRACRASLIEGVCARGGRIGYLSAALVREAKAVDHIEISPAASGRGHSRYPLLKLTKSLLLLILSAPSMSPLASIFLSRGICEPEEEAGAGCDVPRLLCVGGGDGQILGIRRAKELGCRVAVSDANPEAPGIELCDVFYRADTFDPEATRAAASAFGADGLFTYGTDQPVLTVARAAGELSLAQVLSAETALAVTNKRVMKRLFDEAGIPSCRYRILGGEGDLDRLYALEAPLVLKPVDSQGQRGVVKVLNLEEARNQLPRTLSFSREGYALAEEFYEGGEVTFSGWVVDGRLYPLSITDRVTISRAPHIGICVSHNYPSRYMARWGDRILEISRHVVESFAIEEGPVYFQMLIGSEGVKMNEIACRIGGAYEDEFLPLLTGVDVLRLGIEEALYGRPAEASLQELKSFRYPAGGYLSVLLLFTHPLTVASTGEMKELLRRPGVEGGRYLLEPGRRIAPMENSTGRAGYLILRADDREAINSRIEESYSRLAVYDGQGRNRIADYSRESLHVPQQFENGIDIIFPSY